MGYYNGIYYEDEKEMIRAIKNGGKINLRYEIAKKTKEISILKKEIEFLQSKLVDSNKEDNKC